MITVTSYCTLYQSYIPAVFIQFGKTSLSWKGRKRGRKGGRDGKGVRSKEREREREREREKGGGGKGERG